MRARPFVIGRFVLYAVIVAVGVTHVLGRDASGEPPSVPLTEITRPTTQGLPLEMFLVDGRVKSVDLTWRGRCKSGIRIQWDNYFRSGQTGQFRYAGTGFEADLAKVYRWERGLHGLLLGRLQGKAGGGVVRGSVSFTLRTYRGKRLVDTCESGSVGFAIDLPTS